MSKFDIVIQELKKAQSEGIAFEFEEHRNTADLSSFRCGGDVRVFVSINTTDELKRLLKIIAKHKLPYIIIGNGTNTLFRDGEYEGVVIKLSDDSIFFNYSSTNVEGKEYHRDRQIPFVFEPGEKVEVTAGAAMLLSSLARMVVTGPESASGLEALSGIPGSVGGAAFMNAGAYEHEMKEVVKSVHAVSPDGNDERDFGPDELQYGYRKSVFMENGYIITSVTFELTTGDRKEIAERMNEYTRKRVSKQPLNYPSCGSTFKRPEGSFAGKLIQDADLKGISVGGAEVSELHAGFIINKGGATATDVMKLISLVQNTVYDKFGVMLEPEVRII